MSRVPVLSAWEQTVSRQLPVLSRPQARVLALWSFGVVLAQRCGQTSVVAVLAALLGQPENTVRQRLREWLYAADAKRGRARHAVEVERCFAALLGWVLAWWQPARRERRLAVALDATTLGERYVVLALCVLYRSGAVPVAWSVVPAHHPEAWRPHWERLLAQLRTSVPVDWTVLVLADRGLYAPWLFAAIAHLGWHPGLRINGGEAGSGYYRVVGQRTWRPLACVLPRPGTSWQGVVDCFRDHPLRATLLARWEPGYREGWLILTDLPPTQAAVAWYRLRAWVEGGFKDLKRAGWQWQRTRMTAPDRAQRCWLVLAVATLWVVSVGGATAPAPPSATRRTPPRLLSCFRRGMLVLLTSLLLHHAPPTARFVPEPWPTTLARKTYP